MTILIGVVVLLVLLGVVVTMAEASLTRVNLVRAISLREEGRRNGAALVRIEEDLPRYLNSIYLALMFIQNGSAILVAILADRLYGELGITIASVLFALLYFLTVESMSKTFSVLHSDRVALALAPVASVLARVLVLPVSGLIRLGNFLLPGKGLKQGPFVSEEDIRSMADVGHEEGAIEEEEKRLIHSIFDFGDTLTREVMVPRPDMVVVDAGASIQEAMDVAIKHGFSRIPVIDGDPDNILGVVYAKDLFRALRTGKHNGGRVRDETREAFFIPEITRVSELLRQMQSKKVHMAIVVDEYGDVAGLVTMEDILEEIVGEITDEYDVEESRILPLGTNGWRVQAKMPIWEFNELVDGSLPEDQEWQTIGGLVASGLAKIPEAGDRLEYEGFRFRVERVQKRRIGTVLVQRVENGSEPATI